MPTDFLALVRRDHVDLQKDLTQLLDPTASVSQLRQWLDGVRLGLLAHTEAEDIVLARFDTLTALEVQVAQARAAHLAQESALAGLVAMRPATAAWRDQAYHLRELVGYHAAQEETYILPAIRKHAPRFLYEGMAGAFATERLRQLASLQPSEPASLLDLEVHARHRELV